MIKKNIIIIILCIFICGLCACGETGGTSSDTTGRREEYQAFRTEFMASDVYRAAYEYAENAIKEAAPDCPYEISLEPGSIRDLSPYKNFSTDESVRAEFYKSAQLSFSIQSDSDTDEREIASALAHVGISGELRGEFLSYYYIIDGVNDKAEIKYVPEV